ncbi:RNA polymerase sigma factor [Sphingobacterium thalpophilum]|uniref:Probable RNA polymerase sigma factor fecI n=1 Tax=Sphingobacterium thalpophilum TaxID=259 RepID=A0A4U9UM50_9SPHI|nr:sigma-70 family RNA polymerase sigma factor [Sphingobacterium thalpophilum]VTR34675.1 Probable RNA polymerase sigma factor fecI [Sphingobacterium thalpophilum]
MSLNKEKFDQLYYQYHQSVFLNIRKYIKDNDIAQDVLQEVFVSLWENKDNLSYERNIAGWLFVVSSNKAISYFKKHINKNLFLSIDASEIADFSLDESEELASQIYDIQWSILEKAIDDLPQKRREVFCLCKLQGYSYTDVASQLGISIESVKDYIKKSNKSIIRYIEEHYNRDETLIQGLLLILLMGCSF